MSFIICRAEDPRCPPENSPKCLCTCCGGVTYIQPERPGSFRPVENYKSPVVPLDSDTVYKVSYLPHKFSGKGDERTQIIRPVPGIKPIAEKIEGLTTFRLSYLNPVCPIDGCRPSMSRPAASHLGFSGKMDGLTTHKRDYVPKAYSKRDIIPQDGSGNFSDCPMSSITTQRISYLDPTGYGQPATSMRPKEEPNPLKAKLDPTTTYKLSYIPHKDNVPDRDLPWAKQQALKSSGDMATITTYFASYLPPGAVPLPGDTRSTGRCCPWPGACDRFRRRREGKEERWRTSGGSARQEELYLSAESFWFCTVKPTALVTSTTMQPIMNSIAAAFLLLIGVAGLASAGFAASEDLQSEHKEEHHEAKPYNFGYGVVSHKHGVDFGQQETSDGHNVAGHYRVKLPDGRTQVVTYTADWQKGYNAHVEYEGQASHPTTYQQHQEGGLEHAGSLDSGAAYESGAGFSYGSGAESAQLDHSSIY